MTSTATATAAATTTTATTTMMMTFNSVTYSIYETSLYLTGINKHGVTSHSKALSRRKIFDGRTFYDYVVLSGQTVSNMYERRQMFDVAQISSNKVKHVETIVFDRETFLRQTQLRA